MTDCIKGKVKHNRTLVFEPIKVCNRGRSVMQKGRGSNLSLDFSRRYEKESTKGSKLMDLIGESVEVQRKRVLDEEDVWIKKKHGIYVPHLVKCS